MFLTTLGSTTTTQTSLQLLQSFAGTTQHMSCLFLRNPQVQLTEWYCSTCPATPGRVKTSRKTSWVSVLLRNHWWCKEGRACHKKSQRIVHTQRSYILRTSTEQFQLLRQIKIAMEEPTQLKNWRYGCAQNVQFCLVICIDSLENLKIGKIAFENDQNWHLRFTRTKLDASDACMKL